MEGRGRVKDLRLHSIWLTMKTRCYNPKAKAYKDYGGRGIFICEEWKNSFWTFYDWAMENGYRDDLTIDRIDCNKGYSPDNCKWSDYFEQANNRRNSIRLLYRGKKYTPLELSEITGISVNTIYQVHRERHIYDFTNYKPRKSQCRNIVFRKNGYEVCVSQKYCGKYKTLEEAIEVRDNVRKEMGLDSLKS